MAKPSNLIMDRRDALSLRSRIEKARKIAYDRNKDSGFQDNELKVLLPGKVSRVDAKRRRFLQGMHEHRHETKSLTIPSSTAQFEKDRMLYYKAIQEPEIAPLDFSAILRQCGPRPDDTCTRQQQFRKAKERFSKSVSKKQADVSVGYESRAEEWHSLQARVANCSLSPDVSDSLIPTKLVLGRRSMSPVLLPPTPIDAPAVGDLHALATPPMHDEPPCITAAAAAAAAAAEEPGCAVGVHVSFKHVRHAAGHEQGVKEEEEKQRTRSRCASARRPSRRTAQQRMPSKPPVGSQYWAAASRRTRKSTRYQNMATLQLAPNVAIRPDHGCPWDIHDGTYNILITEEGVDVRALEALLEGGWLEPPSTEGARSKEQPRGRFLQETKRKLLARAAAACDPKEKAPEKVVRFLDLEDNHGCSGGVNREWERREPFLEWIHACKEASRRPEQSSAAVNNGIVTSSIKRRNNFLLPVFDDGTGEPEISGHTRQNLAFRKGRLGVAQYMKDRPEAITWEHPLLYASRKVKENVTDAIEKAKLLRMFDRQLVPVACRSQGRTNCL